MLVNPGFEQPEEEPGRIPGWGLYGGADGIVKPGITVTAADGQSSSGANSLLVQDDTAAAAIVVYSDPIEVSGNQTFSFRMKAKDASGIIYAAVRFYKSAGANVVSGYLPKPVYVALPPSQSWTDIAFEAVSPADASFARVLLYTTSAGKGSARFGDLAFSLAEQDNGGTILYELNNLGPQVRSIRTGPLRGRTPPDGRSLIRPWSAFRPSCL